MIFRFRRTGAACTAWVLALYFTGLGYAPSPSSLLGQNKHPRVLIDSARIQELKTRVTGAYATEYASLQGVTPSDAIAAAFVAVMENAFGRSYSSYVDQAYQQVMDRARASFSTAEWTAQNQVGTVNYYLGLVYDWCYHLLSQVQRDSLAAQTVRWLDQGDYVGRVRWGFGVYHNEFANCRYGMVLSMLAAYGNPEFESRTVNSQTYLDKIKDDIYSHPPVINDVGHNGGGWHEGWHYGMHAGFSHFPISMEGWRTATNEDLFAMAYAYGDAGRYFAYVQRPHDKRTAHYDKIGTWSTASPSVGKKGFWRLLATRYQDGYAQHWADITNSGSANISWLGPASRHPLWEILWHDAGVIAAPPSNQLPTTTHLEGDGAVVMRSGYESTDDVFALFRCRDLNGKEGNICRGENSFTLHRKASLAIRSGYYVSYSNPNHTNYYGSEKATNTIHIDGRNQNFSATQHTLTFDSTADYDMAFGDLVFPIHVISHFERYFIRLKPEEYFVVYDRIGATTLDKKRWLLHSVYEPIVSGTVVNTEVANHITTYTGGSTMLITGMSTLHINTLLPKQAHTRKVGGTGYEFWVNETNANYPLSDITAREAGSWRIEVMAPTTTNNETFLHFLFPAPSMAEPNPPQQLLEGPGYNGLSVGNRAILFNQDTTALTALTYTVTGSGTIKHMVCDVQPGFFNVAQNGGGIGTFESGKEALSFTSSGGGSFTITWTAPPGINRPTPSFGSVPIEMLRVVPNGGVGGYNIHLPSIKGLSDVVIYDMQGKLVKRLGGNGRPSGTSMFWDGRNHSGSRVSASTYLCNVRIGSQVLSRRFVAGR